jgi:hypothetical protein
MQQPAEQIDKLRQGGDGNIVVCGGVSLWRALMRLDLIDERDLSLYPYDTGQGAWPNSNQQAILAASPRSTAASRHRGSTSKPTTPEGIVRTTVAIVLSPGHSEIAASGVGQRIIGLLRTARRAGFAHYMLRAADSFRQTIGIAN